MDLDFATAAADAIFIQGGHPDPLVLGGLFNQLQPNNERCYVRLPTARKITFDLSTFAGAVSKALFEGSGEMCWT